jgi:hypothetical protein
VFEIALHNSVVFSVTQTVLSTFDVYCAYGSAHTFSHLNYMKPSCILPYPRLSYAKFGWVSVRLEVHSVRFVPFSILFFTLHIL